MGLLNPLETRISLEMSGDTKLYMLSAKQGDKATRYVVADLSNNGQRYIIPHGAYAVVNVKKPDGKKVYNDCVYSESEVMFELTNQMLAAAGTAYCDIEIRTKDEAEIIKTQTFTIEIEKMMRNDSAILSSDEYTFFEKSMLKVKEITESLNNAKIDFSEAEKRENISTEDTFAVILGKLEKIISEIKEVAFSGEYSDLTGAPEDVGDLTNNAGYVTTDTWKANTADDEGYVEASKGKANQVWGTDAEGNPGWRNAVEEMAGATEETEGAAGIVPAPDAGQQDAFLRGDATWGNLGAAALAGIANNLATTQEGFLLDARQGKELADQISLVNSAKDIEIIVGNNIGAVRNYCYIKNDILYLNAQAEVIGNLARYQAIITFPGYKATRTAISIGGTPDGKVAQIYCERDTNKILINTVNGIAVNDWILMNFCIPVTKDIS